MYLPDRLDTAGQIGPDAQPLKQQTTAMGQCGRTGVIAGLRFGAAGWLRFDQANVPTGLSRASLQRQRQTGADHAAADNDQFITHAGTPVSSRAWAINASMASASLGTSALSTSQPVLVTSTSSSIRMPIPRHLRATVSSSGAI